MENRGIPNGAVTASSTYILSAGCEPWQAHLNNAQTSGSHGSWSALQNNTRQYLQIDLGKERVVNKIGTQGRPSWDQWVTSYKLIFSSHGKKWNEYRNNGAVKVNAMKEIRSLAAWVTIVNSKSWRMSTDGNYSCFLLHHAELTKHRLNIVRGVGWDYCYLCRWQTCDGHSLSN